MEWYTLKKITTIAELLTKNKDWEELYKNSISFPFLNFYYQKEYLNIFKKNKNFLILFFLKNNNLIAIVPLTYKKFFSTYIYNFIGEGYADYLNILIRKNEENNFLKYFFHNLKNFLGNNFCLFLKELHPDSFTYNYLQTFENNFYFKSFLNLQSCYILKLPQTFAEYLKSLGKKTRQHLKYYTKKLKKEFKVEFLKASNDKEIKEFAEIFFHLHFIRWKEKKLPGVFFQKKIRDFHLTLMSFFLQQKMLELHCLKINNNIQAVVYGYSSDKIFYFYQSGFNPEFNKYNLGSIILANVIENTISNKFLSFNFLRGGESYKIRLGAKKQKENGLFILSSKNIMPYIYNDFILWKNSLEVNFKENLINRK